MGIVHVAFSKEVCSALRAESSLVLDVIGMP